MKWFCILSILFSVVSAQPSYAVYEFNYGTYRLSDDCMRCLNEDSFAQQRTVQEQEDMCLSKELENIKEKFAITLDFIAYSRTISLKNYSDVKDKDFDERWQDRTLYLKKSSADFLTFIEKFCDDNRKLHGARASNMIYYYEMIDLINTRLHHLQDDDLNSFIDLKYAQLDDLFTSILDGILISSKDHVELTYQEHQKIEIFLKLSKILSRPEFSKAVSIGLLNRLKKLHAQENNLIALALYEKIKSYF